MQIGRAHDPFPAQLITRIDGNLSGRPRRDRADARTIVPFAVEEARIRRELAGRRVSDENASDGNAGQRPNAREFRGKRRDCFARGDANFPYLPSLERGTLFL